MQAARGYCSAGMNAEAWHKAGCTPTPSVILTSRPRSDGQAAWKQDVRSPDLERVARGVLVENEARLHLEEVSRVLSGILSDPAKLNHD